MEAEGREVVVEIRDDGERVASVGQRNSPAQQQQHHEQQQRRTRMIVFEFRD